MPIMKPIRLSNHALRYAPKRGFTVAEVKGRRQGKGVCDAQITYRMLPYPNPQFRQAIRDWAERLQFPFKEPVK